MARSKKLHYRLIGLPPNGVEERLQEEANRLHLPLPSYITALLIDRDYALLGNGQGLWFPRGMQVLQTTKPVREEMEDISLTDTVKTRAVSAVVAWNDME